MNYEVELNFAQELLKAFGLQFCFLEEEGIDRRISKPRWIGDFLSEEKTFSRIYKDFIQSCEPNVVYQIDDGFQCRHIAFLLPAKNEKRVLAYVEPYIQEMDCKQYVEKIKRKYSLSVEKVSEIETYYRELPVISDEIPVFSIIYTLCTKLYGGAEKFTAMLVKNFDFLESDTVNENKYIYQPLYSAEDMIALEERDDLECQLMQAVSIGQSAKAEKLFAKLFRHYFKDHSANVLSDVKNYLIILNTILRLSVQSGDVPIFYIDKLFFDYEHKIEETVSAGEGISLMKEMVRKYCLLAKNHSMKDYSLLVRKVLTIIDHDLTADLRLRTLATQLNVNHSYLSTLFKKETGCTLTDYINQRRIENAIFLLNSSRLQIQLIAQYSGFSDVNYFAKTFKKIIGYTPKEYRDRITNPV